VMDEYTGAGAVGISAATATSATEGRVLCTIELGLRKVEKVATKNGEPEWHDTTLLKPKVVLESLPIADVVGSV